MTENSAQVVLDEFGQTAVDRLNSIISNRNQKAGILAAANGDAQALLEALRESSDNADVVKINTNIDQLESKLFELESKRDEILKPIVAELQTKAQEGSEGLTAEVDELDSKIRASKNFLKMTYGEGSLALVTSLVGRKNRTNGSGGTGRRIRGFDVYVGGRLALMKNAKGEETSNLSAGAKACNVSTATFQELFFTTQGTKEVEHFKPEISFTVTDKDGNEHQVKCVQAIKNVADHSE